MILFLEETVKSPKKQLILKRHPDEKSFFTKMVMLFNSQIDSSLYAFQAKINIFYRFLYPFIFIYSGTVVTIVALIILHLLTYLCCNLMYESNRLLVGNYKIR